MKILMCVSEESVGLMEKGTSRIRGHTPPFIPSKVTVRYRYGSHHIGFIERTKNPCEMAARIHETLGCIETLPESSWPVIVSHVIANVTGNSKWLCIVSVSCFINVSMDDAQKVLLV